MDGAAALMGEAKALVARIEAEIQQGGRRKAG
jgi:hypothetical protein